MADELKWPIEEIPDADSVFMRAHRDNFRDGELQPGAFKDRGNGMSVNWDKYSSAQETKRQATKTPDNNAVVIMVVRDIRDIDDLKVKHTPQPLNQAHSDVHGLLSGREHRTEMRLLLLGIADIVIPLTPQ